ncbi:MAG: NHL repeat-containing protein, partial [Thermoleophilia bacterium]|nr:NHL repeat-containing protein [Thermoleophilia bacterium]
MPVVTRSVSAFYRRTVFAVALAALALVAVAAFAQGARAALFEWDGVAATGVNPGSIATDAAGRVYVPQRNGGSVLVLDNARNGNRPLAAIGGGRLQDPSAVAVDNRSTIYVADAASDTIRTFGPVYSGADYRGTAAGSGPALGQIRGPFALATDPEPRLYVAEQGNVRVQAFDPARGGLGNLFAFGVADPMPYGPPAGLAIDPLNRFFVSSSAAGAGVRFFDPRGAILGTAVPAGTGAGQVNGASGLDTDAAGRLLVAD